MRSLFSYSQAFAITRFSEKMSVSYLMLIFFMCLVNHLRERYQGKLNVEITKHHIMRGRSGHIFRVSDNRLIKTAVIAILRRKEQAWMTSRSGATARSRSLIERPRAGSKLTAEYALSSTPTGRIMHVKLNTNNRTIT